MAKIPIVIDCDPGVDDSFAIALAHAAPGYEIRAITAVEGNVPAALTRKNALCLAEIFGIDCRVGYGAELPLIKEYNTDTAAWDVHGLSGLGDMVLPDPARKPDEKPAWDIIYEEAVRSGGELLLFATGPLTNIALALRYHPDLPEYISGFCIMGGGSFGNTESIGGQAEFNIWVDPTAAREVFEKMEVYMVGLDATHASAFSPEEMSRLIELCGTSEENWFLRRLTVFSKRNNEVNGMDNNIIHDALAVAAMLYPGVVTFKDCHTEVEDREGADNIGQTILDFEADNINCHFAADVDQPEFFRIMGETCRFYGEKRP